MSKRSTLIGYKYKVLKRLRADEYATKEERKADIKKLRNIILSMGTLAKTLPNNAETERILLELSPDDIKPHRTYDVSAYTCELEKKTEKAPQPKKKTKKTRTIVMNSTGGLSYQMR